jgi:hypothetical protein
MPNRQHTRRPLAGKLCAAGLAGFMSVARAATAAGAEEADMKAVERDRVTMMERVVVSDSRIDRNPWRYASIEGFEVLTRANDDETYWELGALRHGLALQGEVMPKEWLPAPPLPYTVIIDDTDLDSLAVGTVHSQPVVFRSPSDALTWGPLADRIDISTDPVGAYDGDTYAVNSNLHGVDTGRFAYGTISLERIFRCAPPLPRWLIAGLIGQTSGLFRESFAFSTRVYPPLMAPPFAAPTISRAEGPGTLWVTLDETERLLAMIKKDKKAKLAIPPLTALFIEPPPEADRLALWESEAGLFVRWGLMGPGRNDPALSRAFLEFVRRARNEPVTERMFSDCFGFGYAAMQERLAAYLKQVLARPTSVDLDMPVNLDNPRLTPATSDQIGRILGDWMRMQSEVLRDENAELSRVFLDSAGKMLGRAYRDDNGLPPDVDPAGAGGSVSAPVATAGAASPVVMTPFVVSATRLHDPALLAVYGLYEHDIGNVGKAREFLEAAAKAGAVRPKAYLVLAKLRFSEAVAAPQGAEGRISARQAASILEALASALRGSETPETCRLFVETWIQSEARPTEGDIDSIVAGASLFPRETGLAYRTAYLCASTGYPAKASALIQRGLAFAAQAESRRYLEDLRARLPSPATPGAH